MLFQGGKEALLSLKGPGTPPSMVELMEKIVYTESGKAISDAAHSNAYRTVLLTQW